MSILENHLPETEAAAEIHKTPRTLQNWRQRGQGPAWTRIGKTVYYSRDAILTWLKSQEQQPVRSRRAA